jgi:hypothetical protein
LPIVTVRSSYEDAFGEDSNLYIIKLDCTSPTGMGVKKQNILVVGTVSDYFPTNDLPSYEIADTFKAHKIQQQGLGT